ncbi:hypothetical protein [Paenibacillus ferrarius]
MGAGFNLNEVENVNRIACDITSKPLATIE